MLTELELYCMYSQFNVHVYCVCSKGIALQTEAHNLKIIFCSFAMAALMYALIQVPFIIWFHFLLGCLLWSGAGRADVYVGSFAGRGGNITSPKFRLERLERGKDWDTLPQTYLWSGQCHAVYGGLDSKVRERPLKAIIDLQGRRSSS